MGVLPSPHSGVLLRGAPRSATRISVWLAAREVCAVCELLDGGSCTSCSVCGSVPFPVAIRLPAANGLTVSHLDVASHSALYGSAQLDSGWRVGWWVREPCAVLCGQPLPLHPCCGGCRTQLSAGLRRCPCRWTARCATFQRTSSNLPGLCLGTKKVERLKRPTWFVSHHWLGMT